MVHVNTTYEVRIQSRGDDEETGYMNDGANWEAMPGTLQLVRM